MKITIINSIFQFDEITLHFVITITYSFLLISKSDFDPDNEEYEFCPFHPLANHN